jgi:hypothetical protein
MLTADQVVALNIRHWRREAGITQEELGARLGWSAANVSAAERSADDGRDRRRFDAETLTALALGLGIPLIALFLPPQEGGGELLVSLPAGGAPLDMAGLMAGVVMPDSDSDTDVMAAYRRRLLDAVGRYMGQDWRAVASRWLMRAEGPEAVAECARRFRGKEADAIADAQWFGQMAGAMEAEAAGSEP